MQPCSWPLRVGKPGLTKHLFWPFSKALLISNWKAFCGPSHALSEMKTFVHHEDATWDTRRLLFKNVWRSSSPLPISGLCIQLYPSAQGGLLLWSHAVLCFILPHSPCTWCCCRYYDQLWSTEAYKSMSEARGTWVLLFPILVFPNIKSVS